MGGRDHTNVTNFSIQSGEGESSFFCKSVWNMQFVKWLEHSAKERVGINAS